jgi:hypothetical protein
MNKNVNRSVWLTYIYTGEVFAGQRVQRFVPAESARGKLLE